MLDTAPAQPHAVGGFARLGTHALFATVADMRTLTYGREFDLVVSVGLIEHFPDEHTPTAFEFHRRFVKPGGYVIMTTPRDQLRSRAY